MVDIELESGQKTHADKVLDVAVVLHRSMVESAVARMWTASGVKIVQFTINYPEKKGDEVIFWVVYSAKEAAIKRFSKWFNKFGTELSQRRVMIIDDSNDEIVNSPFFALFLSNGMITCEPMCVADDAHFAFITMDGYHFDFDAEDQPVAPLILMLANRLVVIT